MTRFAGRRGEANAAAGRDLAGAKRWIAVGVIGAIAVGVGLWGGFAYKAEVDRRAVEVTARQQLEEAKRRADEEAARQRAGLEARQKAFEERRRLAEAKAAQRAAEEKERQQIPAAQATEKAEEDRKRAAGEAARRKTQEERGRNLGGASARAEEERAGAEAPPRSVASAKPAPPVPASELPDFSPWPPPEPTGRHLIAADLVTGKGHAKTWGQVAERFEQSLAKVGYSEIAYYAVPGGFAVATRVEQIEIDGRPASERWIQHAGPLTMSTWTLEGILRRLVGAPLGHYRAIVFVFSEDAFGLSAESITSADADAWRREGLNRLPAPLRSRAYGAEFRCDALIYQFQHSAEREPPVLVRGGLTGEMHLARTGFLDVLRR